LVGEDISRNERRSYKVNRPWCGNLPKSTTYITKPTTQQTQRLPNETASSIGVAPAGVFMCSEMECDHAQCKNVGRNWPATDTVINTLQNQYAANGVT
jgi:hypothetical protein